MTSTGVSLRQGGFGATSRSDVWWLQPLLVLLGLSAFIAYSTWAALQGAHYYWGPYISPFYSPEIYGPTVHSWLGPRPGWWPGLIPFSPAFLILWIPAGFRLTCYYYRGAYYKAFWADPPSCAVAEPRQSYRGEHSFPLIMQNVHRYFLYLALAFVLFLAHDVWEALWFVDPATGKAGFGIGVGTLVLTVNVILLGSYTLGCHSLRHLLGGRLDSLRKFQLRQQAYACSSCLNRRHMLCAWLSLFWVGFSDLYIRLCSMGIWTDWRIL